MLYVSDEAVERFIKEDMPYIDLTTMALGIGQKHGRIEFSCREKTVLAGVEEVIRVFNKLGVRPGIYLHSGDVVESGEVFLSGEGSAESLHAAWKVSLNILEYCSGIATRTRRLVEKARGVAPGISILTTRKSFPGTKELAIKAVVAGGGVPHRLGLSETILIFKQHMVFLGGVAGLAGKITEMRREVCEKKIIVEVETVEQALVLARAGVDGLQFDKMEVDLMRVAAEQIRGIDSKIVLLAAGGISENNVEAYAATGVDAIVTTSVYFGKPADISVKIESLG